VETIGSNDLHPEYYGWYRGGDIVRFAEPMLGLLFSFWIFHTSGILNYDPRTTSFNQAITMVYMFGVTLYLQGGAFHSASNMFKHGVDMFLDDYIPISSINTPEEVAQREYMEDFRYWMRTVWQHIVSHYIYAVGAVIMQVCVVVAYRNHTLCFTRETSAPSLASLPTLSPLRGISLWSSATTNRQNSQERRPSAAASLAARDVTVLSRLVVVNGVLYSLLLSSVAINFPSGLIVGFVYFPLYLFASFWFTHNAGDWNLLKKSFPMFLSSRPVVNMYTLAYSLAIILMLVWVAIVGGLQKRSNA